MRFRYGSEVKRLVAGPREVTGVELLAAVLNPVQCVLQNYFAYLTIGSCLKEN
jgi:hypothetical protein